MYDGGDGFEFVVIGDDKGDSVRFGFGGVILKESVPGCVTYCDGCFA